MTVLYKQASFMGLLLNNSEVKRHTRNRTIYSKLWELAYGRIPKGYEIHYLDRNPENNRLENFLCIPQFGHRKLHGLTKSKTEAPIRQRYQKHKNRLSNRPVNFISILLAL